MKITFSNTLDNVGSMDNWVIIIKHGFFVAFVYWNYFSNFNLSGKIPLVKHWFKINVTGLHISCLMCFNRIGDIPSTPLLDFDGSLSIMFNTSTSVIYL